MLLFPISQRTALRGVSMWYRLIFILFDGFLAPSAHDVHVEGCRTSDICKKKRREALGLRGSEEAHFL